MTVTEQSSRKVILGAGWVNPLTHAYVIESAAHVHVFADAVELVQGVDYTVTNVLNPAGYAVTITNPGSWAPTNWVLDARPPIDQQKDLTVGGTFGAKFEDGLDKLDRRLQRIWDLARRGLKTSLMTPVGDNPYTLPAPNANKLLGWRADGADLENFDPLGIGIALVDNDTGLTSDSPARVPTQHAAKSYTDAAKAAAIAASNTYTDSSILSRSITKVATVAALAALSFVVANVAIVYDDGDKNGIFVASGNNLSTFVAADTAKGIYVAPTVAPGGVNGAWVRQSIAPFSVEWFGAKGDVKTVTGNVSITTGTPNLTLVGAGFTAADVGKRIIVPGAGGSGNVLTTTIAAFVDATHVTLTGNAGTTLTASSQQCAWGTDDTAAIQAAANLRSALGGGFVGMTSGKAYAVTAAVAVPVNVSITGQDKYRTRVCPMVPNISCFTMINAVLTFQNSTISGLRFEAFCTGITGIQTQLASRVAFTQLEFLGVNANTIDMDRGFYFTIRDILSYGANGFQAGGSRLWSSSDTDYLYHGVVDNWKIVSIGNGTAAVGLFCRRLIDTQLTNVQSYAAFSCTVISLENDCQAVKISDLNVDGCDIGVKTGIGTGPVVAPSYTTISDSHIDQPTTYGVLLNNAQYTTLSNVGFTARAGFQGATAISCASDLRTKIVDCRAQAFTTGAAGVGIQLNNSTNTMIRAFDAASCWIGVGVAGTCTNIEIDGDFSGATTPISGTLGTGAIVKQGCRGVDGITLGYVVQAQSVPATTVSKTNSTGFTVFCTIMGGTFTVVSINGRNMAVANNNFNCILKPGDTVAITYTAAPGMNWIAL